MFHCCSCIVASIFLRALSPAPPTPTSHLQSYPPLWLCPWVLYTCSLMTLPFFPIIHLLPPPQLLSICSLFQCLWLYFSCLLVLLIRFHLLVRSYRRSVKLIFTGGHISFTVAFKGPNVILGLYECNYSLTVKRELGTATG